MHDIEYWKKLGFKFDVRFTGEYDLWVNPKTFQYLRLYVNGQAWLRGLETGEYELVEDKTNGN